MNSSAFAAPSSIKPQWIRIEKLGEGDLSQVAEYLAAWRSDDAPSEGSIDSSQHSKKIERQLAWRLLKNPARRSESELGYCIRNERNEVIGTILLFPNHFLLGDRHLTGLCSSCFFVQPEARLQALLIFKKYLAQPQSDFYFGTTCSSYSAKLWQKLHGWAVPNSQFEYIVPFRTAALLEALADSKHLHRNWATLARIIGGSTDILRTILIRRVHLKAQKCTDWDRIAELSRRYRDPNLLTNERSPKFLEWRYGCSVTTPGHEVYCFSDKNGNEGWLSIGRVQRGGRGQIRGAVLLDAVWPRQKIEFSDILATAAELSSSSSDALFLTSRPGVQYGRAGQMTFRRKFEAPQGFVLTSKATDTIPPGTVDFVPADGDSTD